ncbi:FluG domain-containing protein [Trichoderma ceciliae]
MSNVSHSLHARYPTNHVDFIRQFTEQEIQEKIAKKQRPKPLTAEQRIALRGQLGRKRRLNPRFAEQTKLNISRILPKWKNYCESSKMGPWEEALLKADKLIAMDFILFICDNYKIKSENTSWVYFRQYKQLYTSVTGASMSRDESREIKNFHDTIVASRHGLRPPNTDGKPVMGSYGLLHLLIFNIGYDTKTFPIEGHRVQLAGCWIFLASTGARPAEIVDNEKSRPNDGSYEELWFPKTKANDDETADDEHSRLLEEMLCRETVGRGRPKALCYEDVSLMVVRHPTTKENVLCMAVKFIHHKGVDNKPKPTIFFFTMTRRVIFCPVTIMISLALRDKAFHAPGLDSVHQVFRIKNIGPVNCTHFRWKDSMLKIPIFRRYEGNSLSSNRPLQYSTLRDELKREWHDAGNEEDIDLKAFRRMAANGINSKAPDTVRDQAMRHDPKWATFNSAYINEKVEFHVQNAILDEPLEEDLIQLWSHMSMTRDPRAASNMVPDEVWRNMQPDTEITKLKLQRERLKGARFRVEGRDDEAQIRALGRQIKSKTAQRDKKVKIGYRKYYFRNRSTWDIERQLRGEVEDDEEEEEYVAPAIKLHIPERAELAEILINQPDNPSLKDITKIRVRAAELMTILNNKRETVRSTRIQRRKHAELMVKEELSELNSFPLLMKKTQCPECIGDARLSRNERIFEYCRPTVMNDHFDNEHLKEKERAEQDRQPIPCMHPMCQEEETKFNSLDQYRNHVQSVHTVLLRTSERVEHRRAKKSRLRQLRRSG